ncbi:MAG: glycoside hydrolase family 9 protein [Cytophagaceae bacterium]
MSFIIIELKAQTGLFNDFPNVSGWTGGANYSLSDPSGTEMVATGTNVGPSYQTFSYNFSSLDLSAKPFLQIKMKSAAAVKVRIDFKDINGKVTNAVATSITIPGNGNYADYTYDFNGKFSQSYPATSTVDPTQITGLIVYYNPGGSTGFSGTVYFDSLRIGSNTNIPAPPKAIKLNQIGFYPNMPKLAIAAQAINDTFYLVSSDKQDTLFKDKLAPAANWTYSGETVRKADFSVFKTPGSYYISLDSGYSLPFTIASSIHNSAAKGILKSYYYNRASMAITAPWGGLWTRASGHPDNVVYVHSSAATAQRPANFVFSSPRGWYDAGDYNKYAVNSGITTYNILALYEHYPSYFDTLNTNIPESGNNIPDILDEALWEIRWLLTTQDPNDGGVYHKITSLNFDGIEMPSSDHATRYAVDKGTAATLDFAAVMAQAYRIFSKFPAELPQLADSCLNASVNAYNWAVANPSVKITANPTGVNTGTYGDNNLNDEFSWARMELYAATRNDNYYRSADLSLNFSVPGWANVNTLGLITLVNYRKALNTAGYADTSAMVIKMTALADIYKNYYPGSAYGIAMGKNTYDFNWGSNSNAGNQGMLMLQAFRITGDSSYLKGALANLDYLFGRNGTGYSFVTGFGSKLPVHPHHRMSEADPVNAPIPGMIVGGANPGQEDGCSGYPSGLAGKSYVDSFCSFATNEPAINYTAAGAYLTGAIEALMAGASFSPAYSTPPAPVTTSIKGSSGILSVNIYPNPARDRFNIEFENQGSGNVEITDLSGKQVWNHTVSENGSVSMPVSTELSPGIYFVKISTENGVAVRKLEIQ